MKRTVCFNFATFFTICFLITTGLFAQTILEGSNITAIEVNDINRNDIDTDPVLLIGHLTEKIGDQKYIFTDGTGKIIVYIDDEYFPRPRKITDEDIVEIVGEIFWNDQNSPEIVASDFKVIIE